MTGITTFNTAAQLQAATTAYEIRDNQGRVPHQVAVHGHPESGQRPSVPVSTYTGLLDNTVASLPRSPRSRPTITWGTSACGSTRQPRPLWRQQAHPAPTSSGASRWTPVASPDGLLSYASEPIPFEEALRARDVKRNLPTTMSSAELAQLAVDTRERAISRRARRGRTSWTTSPRASGRS